VCNLLCTIDEVFLFTQVTIINMVATCLCFTLKIQSGRIRKQIEQDNCSLIQRKNRLDHIELQLDSLCIFDTLLFGLLMVLVGS